MQNTEPIIKCGWLTKQGGFIKTWRKRWFILQGRSVHYYKEPGMREKGKMMLDSAISIERAPEAGKPYAFKINIPKQRVFYIHGETEEDVDEWMKLLEIARKGEKPLDPTHIGLNDFETIKVLGRGTYGKVVLVRHIKDGQMYAMKSMSKRALEEYDQIDQILTEKNVLMKVAHPFLVSAHYTFQSKEKIFMVIDYVPGGELFSRLKEEQKFNENRARLYAAEILCGLGHLHSLGFVYRDLKPENVLVDERGHLRITDFGLVKGKMGGGTTTTTFCGTPEYIAPEILQQFPYTKAVDWWSFGIIIFEMLTGMPPFYDENMTKMYRQIINSEIVYPHYVSPNAKDLLTRLLAKDPLERLGSSDADAEEIKAHPFFSELNWDEVLEKKTQPEWVPKIAGETDTRNFSSIFTAENPTSHESEHVISGDAQKYFNGFTCTDESKLKLP